MGSGKHELGRLRVRLCGYRQKSMNSRNHSLSTKYVQLPTLIEYRGTGDSIGLAMLSRKRERTLVSFSDLIAHAPVIRSDSAVSDQRLQLPDSKPSFHIIRA